MASGKSGWSERELIINISEIFAAVNPSVLVGIGDDAAILARPENHMVVTTDMAVEDVHFKVNWSSAEEIGRKIADAVVHVPRGERQDEPRLHAGSRRPPATSASSTVTSASRAAVSPSCITKSHSCIARRCAGL